MAKPTPSTTQDHINIAEIREGILITRDGGLRTILLAASVNFALKSEQEQNALIAQYQAFLNSLNFPLQIIMQSRKLDLTNYLKSLEERLAKENSELIKVQISDYIQFIKRLITVANIMDKQFYLIVPFDPSNVKKRGLVDKLLHPTSRLEVKISATELKSFHEELLQRVQVVMAGLNTLGVRTAILNTQQIIELFYSLYNPEEASKERLIGVEDLESPMVGKEK